MMKTKLILGVSIVVLLAFLCWLGVTLLQHFSVNFLAPIPPAMAGTVRVACVGDSTTYGMLLWNRAANCYPARLQTLLGDGYSVRNFAANATTVLKTGDHPYTDHRVYGLSGEFAPDIVLIMLGTNDAKRENTTTFEAFRADYRALLAHYTNLPSHPQVYVMTPPAVVAQNGKTGYNIDIDVLGEYAQIIREEADDLGLPLIDIHAQTAGDNALVSRIDGVHPGKKGADLIARLVYAAMTETGV